LCQQRSKLQLERFFASGRRLPSPASGSVLNPLNWHPRATRDFGRQRRTKFSLQFRTNLTGGAQLLFQGLCATLPRTGTRCFKSLCCTNNQGSYGHANKTPAAAASHSATVETWRWLSRVHNDLRVCFNNRDNMRSCKLLGGNKLWLVTRRRQQKPKRGEA
jgi:hypothetical protein